MHIHISTLRTLVTGFLNPDRLKEITPACRSYWTEQLPVIREQLFEEMRLEVFSAVNDRVIERHIQQVQKDCIEMMNVLQGYTVHGVEEGLYQEVFSCLEQILRHIEKHHSRFFDLNAELPNGYFRISVEDIAQKIKLLKALFKKHRLENELQQGLLHCATSFIRQEACTYQELLYLKDLIESVLLLQYEEITFEEALKEHLLYYRFNHPEFWKYYSRKIESELSLLYDQQEKYERLCLYEKQLKAQQERSCANFIPVKESIKTMLLDFVKAELKFLQRKQMSFFSAGDHRQLERKVNTYRMKVSLSVDGLAYLIRLMVEAGVILSGSRSELLEFISRHLQTPGIGAGHLSVKSLNNKYKQVVQSTINAVRAALMRMLKILDGKIA
ncbi:hypothetical protein DBR11_10575 [Pedobacter sp. HMWF019]|uniref:hypothetical protein n=1 Tax=Pedobacter sp. HMWF019 TaxID=2056856 RepID=UPI000D34E9E7|nr:hypothetical protein [Pedobacter sp. HMWF019]PTT00205.1 hypothetical protein DBR11_10575 [Pedobacter sp. HMWF019]